MAAGTGAAMSGSASEAKRKNPRPCMIMMKVECGYGKDVGRVGLKLQQQTLRQEVVQGV